MTQEEAIKILRDVHDKSLFSVRNALETLIPELAESEDERIRKQILDCFGTMRRQGCFPSKHKEQYDSWISWLEKQKEQKPAEWSYPYGENEMVDRLVSIAECLEMDGDCLFNGYTGTECGKFLRDLARKQVECKSAEWSEEEYGRLFDIEHYLDGTLQLSPDRKIACIDFFKSLRPSWKPSEEQMNALQNAVAVMGYEKELTRLYNQLKAL